MPVRDAGADVYVDRTTALSPVADRDTCFLVMIKCRATAGIRSISMLLRLRSRIYSEFEEDE